jgi:hypothetical protein
MMDILTKITAWCFGHRAKSGMIIGATVGAAVAFVVIPM